MRIAVSRRPGAERDVTPLELFFDLVYVFAIGQLSHHLADHVDLRTGAETAVLALAVFYAWYMVAWGANWLDPDPLAVRVSLVGLMFASLLMSVAIDDAFDDLAWLFVTGYLLLQVGRCVFLIAALHGRPQGEHFVNDLVWEMLAGVLWVMGAIAGDDARLLLWALAVVVSYGGGWVQHWLPGRGRRVDLEHTEIAAGHLVERFRLFFIIVLGETVLTMGTAFAGEPFVLDRLLVLSAGFVGTVALWWCYFQRAEALGARAAETAEDAGAVGLWGTWTLTLIVLGLDRDRRRRRACDRRARRRPDARLLDPGIRRTGTVPARAAPVPARDAGTSPEIAGGGACGARGARGRHRAIRSRRRGRGVERRAPRGRHQGHGPGRRAGSGQAGVDVQTLPARRAPAQSSSGASAVIASTSSRVRAMLAPRDSPRDARRSWCRGSAAPARSGAAAGPGRSAAG
jgi:low temperature requirement protein LtrA